MQYCFVCVETVLFFVQVVGGLQHCKVSCISQSDNITLPRHRPTRLSRRITFNIALMTSGADPENCFGRGTFGLESPKTTKRDAEGFEGEMYGQGVVI